MTAEWVGSVVSLDCGDSLGTYQGQVKCINSARQTLTLSNAFRNGLRCEIPDITLSATDIQDLKILRSPEDAKDLYCRKATPSKLSKQVEESINPKCPSPVKVLHTSATTPNGFQTYPQHSHGVNGHSKRLTPTHDYGQFNGQNGLGSWNGGHNNRLTPTGDSDGRKSGGNDNKPVRKASTPRKIEGRNNNARRGSQKQDCFSAPVDSFLNEFDFEKNLALFDKQAVFAEIENGMPEGSIIDRKPTKYRCDENVLNSGPVILQQIKAPSVTGAKSYVTDSGLVVPSISAELRSRLLSTAVSYGITVDRQVEMVGRSASEMVLQLLGGCHRLSPQNGHQLPVVVVLCGPHAQGAKGINCARQLANHNVKTIVYVPNIGVKIHPEVERELKLYELCDGKKTSNPKDLPSGPVDMIVNALDNDENTQLRLQPWYKPLVDWAGNKRANCLAIDPPVEGSAIDAKWCLAICMPLSLKSANIQVYLCDLGIPKKVYTEVGIKYMSPFGHKFVIPLHVRT